jgi:hypothetical protein
MKALIIAREFPIKHRDILIASLFPEKIKIEFIVWNRHERLNKPDENTYVFKSRIEKLRSIKFFFLIKEYVIFIDDIISKTNPQLLIISHYSLYIPFLLLSKKRGLKIILDVHDLPSFNNIISFQLALLIEKIIIRNVNYLFLASKYFKPFYTGKKTLVIDNIPSDQNSITNALKGTKNGIIRIGFVGKLRYPDLYKLMIKCINKFDNLQFHFYGDGSAEEILRDFCNKLNTNNVFFHGLFNKNDLEKIYSEIDLSWACYPPNNYNVKYATSNKALESLHFNTPCVFSSGTLLAKDYKSKNLGFSINPNNKAEIIYFFENLNREKLDTVSKNIFDVDTTNINSYRKSLKDFLKL